MGALTLDYKRRVRIGVWADLGDPCFETITGTSQKYIARGIRPVGQWPTSWNSNVIVLLVKGNHDRRTKNAFRSSSSSHLFNGGIRGRRTSCIRFPRVLSVSHIPFSHSMKLTDSIKCFVCSIWLQFDYGSSLIIIKSLEYSPGGVGGGVELFWSSDFEPLGFHRFYDCFPVDYVFI